MKKLMLVELVQGMMGFCVQYQSNFLQLKDDLAGLEPVNSQRSNACEFQM